MFAPNSITRSKRKTMAITISKMGEIAVKAPLNVSDTRIQNFLKSKEHWIEEKLKRINKNLTNFNDVIQYERVLVLGDKYKPVYSENKNIDIDDYGKFFVPIKYTTPEKVYIKTKQWYKQLAKQILCERIDYLSEKLRITPNKFKINDSRGRWGACNQRGEIIINFRVIMLPPNLIDYVLIHEMSHLIEMNHSNKFWSVMATFMPNFNTARQEIKNYSFCLGLFN